MTLRSPMIKFLPEQNCPLLQSCFAELVFAIWEPCINVERPQSEGYYYDQPWRDLIRDDLHWLWSSFITAMHYKTLNSTSRHGSTCSATIMDIGRDWSREALPTPSGNAKTPPGWRTPIDRSFTFLDSMAPWLLRNRTTYSPSLTRISLGACNVGSDVLTRLAKALGLVPAGNSSGSTMGYFHIFKHKDLYVSLAFDVDKIESMVALREEVGRMMLSWSDFSATLGFFEERYTEEIAEDIGFPVQDMRVVPSVSEQGLRRLGAFLRAWPNRNTVVELRAQCELLRNCGALRLWLCVSLMLCWKGAEHSAQLLSFCIEAIFVLAIMGRQGLLEHPAEPEADDGISIGKDCRGQFQTAHLKEYPPALCTALAEVTWNATCTAPANDTAQLPVHFQEVCAKLNVTEHGDHVGPDFVHYGRPEVNSFVLRRVACQHLPMPALIPEIQHPAGGRNTLALADRWIPTCFSSFAPTTSEDVMVRGAKSFPGSIAFRHAQRQAIMSDPNWRGGDYYDGQLPANGLRLARQLGTITYRSGLEWQQRFGQSLAKGITKREGLKNEFMIENYLAHQGEKWVNAYDPNSLLWISKAMDGFSLEKLDKDGNPCLLEGLKGAMMPALVIGVQHDVLFPVWQQKEIADTLRKAGNKGVVYYELDSIYGHDSFLLDAVSIGPAVKGHLEQEPDGARHIWEDLASSAVGFLQAISQRGSTADSMRDIFRALSNGEKALQDVERDRLKAMVKLVWSRGEMGRIHASLPCWDQVAVDKAFENMAKEPLMELGPWMAWFYQVDLKLTWVGIAEVEFDTLVVACSAHLGNRETVYSYVSLAHRRSSTDEVSLDLKDRSMLGSGKVYKDQQNLHLALIQLRQGLTGTRSSRQRTALPRRVLVKPEARCD
ncbi:unnamed protein product [Cladocopium goreaui]|uniref:Serine-O-acetyltransferase cys2 n=1 Tax=Cladocopium goreaui TaxID=2562237 RepID=A0A9P1D534_9DINO|nr:unnamed protein product [Cladocopium goreaui]